MVQERIDVSAKFVSVPHEIFHVPCKFIVCENNNPGQKISNKEMNIENFIFLTN